MIDEIKTFEKFGYYSSDWALKSHKKIVAICDNCEKERFLRKVDYRDLCRSCSKGIFIKERNQNINEERTKSDFGYTSDELSDHSNKKVWAICERCNNERLVDFHQYSKLCKLCIKFGRVVTEETRQKMSEINTGRIPSEETRQKMRKKHLGTSGKNHYKWNPNLTTKDRNDKREYSEYREWRSNIYKRDDYTCQICGERGHVLNAHHLDGYKNNPDKRILLENGVTLCKECHNNFHHQYGYNNTKEQFIDFKKIESNKNGFHFRNEPKNSI